MPKPSDLAQRARRLAALNQAALAIAGDLDLDRVLEKTLKTAAHLVVRACRGVPLSVRRRAVRRPASAGPR